jgi:hypothetical protein
MKKKLMHIILIFSAVMLTGLHVYSQVEDDITVQLNRIRDAEKVEHLYPVKYNLDRLSSLSEMTLPALRLSLTAHMKLAEEFKSYNHFRNAIDVYNDYLNLRDTFHHRYRTFIVDSVQNASASLITQLENKKQLLNNEIASLERKKVKIESLQSAYRGYSIAGTILLLIIGLIIGMRQRKTLVDLRTAGSELEEKTKLIYRRAVEVRIMQGAIYHIGHLAAQYSQAVERVTEYYRQHAVPGEHNKTLLSLSESGKIFEELSPAHPGS